MNHLKAIASMVPGLEGLGVDGAFEEVLCDEYDDDDDLEDLSASAPENFGADEVDQDEIEDGEVQDQGGSGARSDAYSDLPSDPLNELDRSDLLDDSEEEQAGDAGPSDAGSIRLLPGEHLVPGTRLTNLFEALEKNRELQEKLRAVLDKVERLIHRNWQDDTALKQLADQSSSKTSASDPLLRMNQSASSHRPHTTTSRFWRMNGLTPAPNPDSTALAGVLSRLPTTFERTRWCKSLVEQLRLGVLTEVRQMLTEQVLRGAPGTRETLDAEFERIKAVTPESREAQELVCRFSAEQWRRVSLSFVKDREPNDCRIFYNHFMSPLLEWSLEESAKLSTLAIKHRGRNWEAVAAELGHGRSAAQCLQHYLKVNRPEHVRSRMQWTREDDEQLQKMVASHGTCWVKISAEMGGKFDRHQLRDRWHGQTQRKHDRNLGRWDPKEDERLQQAVLEVRKKWPLVSAMVRTRTPQQCRERFYNVLSPDLARKPFSQEQLEELRVLCEGHEKAHEGRIIWKEVAKAFPGRTDEMCLRIWNGMKKFGLTYVPGERSLKKVHTNKEPSKAPPSTKVPSNTEVPANAEVTSNTEVPQSNKVPPRAAPHVVVAKAKAAQSQKRKRKEKEESASLPQLVEEGERDVGQVGTSVPGMSVGAVVPSVGAGPSALVVGAGVVVPRLRPAGSSAPHSHMDTSFPSIAAVSSVPEIGAYRSVPSGGAGPNGAVQDMDEPRAGQGCNTLIIPQSRVRRKPVKLDL